MPGSVYLSEPLLEAMKDQQTLPGVSQLAL